jgi:hypothetical protein
VLKRQREQKRAEKAAHKREARAQRGASTPTSGPAVASEEDLAGYGGPPPPGGTSRDANGD